MGPKSALGIFVLKVRAATADTSHKQSGSKGAGRLNPRQRMEMPLNLNAWSAGRQPPGGTTGPHANTPLKSDGSEDLLTAKSILRELPAARSVSVRRARRLVLDPNYPPSETLEQIARLFALHWPCK